jgi:RNA polymerase sigma-B factor
MSVLTTSQESVAIDATTKQSTDLDGYLAVRLNRMSALPVGDAHRNQLRDEVICACLPVVRRLAGRFFGRGESNEDLVQVATIGLIKAVDRFDPDRETQFLSYATPTIVGEIKRHFRDKGWSVRVSRPMQELYLSITRLLPEMAQELGRSPRVDDLAERLGVSGEEIMRGLECGQAYTARSLSAPVGGEEGGIMLADMLGGDDERMESVADRQTLRQLLAEVPERERNIIALRFFANLTQSEIAERVGVSQMHVSRLLTRTLSDLRTRLLAD